MTTGRRTFLNRNLTNLCRMEIQRMNNRIKCAISVSYCIIITVYLFVEGAASWRDFIQSLFVIFNEFPWVKIQFSNWFRCMQQQIHACQICPEMNANAQNGVQCRSAGPTMCFGQLCVNVSDIRSTVRHLIHLILGTQRCRFAISHLFLSVIFFFSSNFPHPLLSQRLFFFQRM